jgi:hypothetical protein
VNLSSAELTDPNFSGANLSSANLSGATLSSADLVVANLSSADLSGANLSSANLSGAYLDANFTGAILDGANLTGALLGREGWGLTMGRADFTGAFLFDANLTSADLYSADFTGAVLSGANLTGANLTGANLGSANLTGADLTGTDLSGATLTGAKGLRTGTPKFPQAAHQHQQNNLHRQVIATSFALWAMRLLVKRSRAVSRPTWHTIAASWWDVTLNEQNLARLRTHPGPGPPRHPCNHVTASPSPTGTRAAPTDHDACARADAPPWREQGMVLACGLVELASFFGQFQGRSFPLVEAFGVGPVNAGAGDAVEGSHSVTRTAAGCSPFGVHDRHSCVGLAS